MDDPQEIDITKLKYVLYARKSSKDKEHQVRSIPDQISDCQKFMEDLHLNIVSVLRESGSAKSPDQRKIYRDMINDIKRGKYDAIIAWNPDRLARNMLEGGEIINLVDEGILKDLKFKTHYFTNDANGKMLLGMAFVLSKQYSDDLSQKVKRGVTSRFKEGKTSSPKHGYINDSGIFRPDGQNFELICEAWQMRLQGESLAVISNYMNKNGYGKKVKKDGRIIKISTKTLTYVFHDPFYYGSLVQAGQTVNLKELDPTFEPAITEEEYNHVQLTSKKRLTPYNIRRGRTFYPFKAIVRCAYCQHNMVVAPSKSRSGERYLYYRCDYLQCDRQKLRVPKSVRGKVILNFLRDFFANNFKLTENDYKRYYEKLDKLTGTRRIKIKTQIRSYQGSITALNTSIGIRSIKIVDMKLEGTAKGVNLEKIDTETDQKKQIEREIIKLKEKLTDPEKDRLSLKQFLNLSKKAPTIIKSANPMKKDAIVRIIFLNLNVGNAKVLSYQLKPTFEQMLKLHKSTSSRGDWS